MRVITGEAKGQALKWPKTPHIRPTTDRVREAVFSALGALDVNWSRVLDLFAGTGAMGIEALSRGAERADFVEQDPRCCDIIKENLERTGLSGKAVVYRLEARKALKKLTERYGVVFLDPPYEDEMLLEILEDVAKSQLPGGQATIVMEHSPKYELTTTYGEFHMVKQLHHGDTCISIYQRRGGVN